MRKIADMIDNINEELDDAKNYAEKYIELKALGDDWSNKFLEMAFDELKHADNLRQYALGEISRIEKVYVLPVDIARIWEESHKRFVETSALVKQMLKM